MKLFLILIALLVSLPSIAAPVPSGLRAQPLVSISNSSNKKVATLSILIDEQERVAGLYSQGGDTPDQVHWLKDYEKKEGVPLVQRDTSIGNLVLISLRGRMNRETQEGRGQAIYLSNALFGTKEFCDFEIHKDADSNKWFIKNVYTKKPVSKIHVLAGSMGVTGLQGLCPVEGK